MTRSTTIEGTAKNISRFGGAQTTRKPYTLICLLMGLMSGGPCLAQEFRISEYRAYALMGEARLTDETDYVSFTGDFGFSDWLPTNEVIERHLGHESSLISNFRLSVINLEGILLGFSRRELDSQNDNVVVGILKKGGYDLVARANNHTLDHGLEGVRYNTIRLRQEGLNMIGLRQFPVYEWETSGQRVVIYAMTDSTDKEDPDRLVLQLNEADLAFIRQQTSQAHFRIAFVHLGSMSSFPSPHERKQVPSCSRLA